MTTEALNAPIISVWKVNRKWHFQSHHSFKDVTKDLQSAFVSLARFERFLFSLLITLGGSHFDITKYDKTHKIQNYNARHRHKQGETHRTGKETTKLREWESILRRIYLCEMWMLSESYFVLLFEKKIFFEEIPSKIDSP